MQSGFAIKVLALKSEILFLDEIRLADLFGGVAPDLITRLPNDMPVRFGQLLGQAVEVVV